MIRGRLSLFKWAVIGILVIAINGALYLAMSSLSRKQENNQFNSYERPVLLTIPKEPPPLSKEKKKPLKKKKLKIKKLKVPSIKQAKVKPPPDFDFGEVGSGFGFETEISLGITPGLPMFQAPKTLFDLSELDQKPRLLYKIDPIYPYSAKRRNQTGSITLQFIVDSNGNVGQIKVLKSEPLGVFDKSAVNAVTKWRFKPGFYQGEAVATRVIVPINFQL
ncbi:MAG: energy transducer TonB [Proteobacteria bacterium]|nr:energy transducer TonB [Pseudomonadota bacterium]